MGLLTDPSAGQGKFTKLLLKYYVKLGFLLYIGGIAYFCSLADSQSNLQTYFSENALLPGLVRSEFRDEHIAKLFYEELLDEMKKYEDSIPYPWLLAKFKQIGLDTYTHNFTLHYPLGRPKKFTGKNVYGILRAPRAASTEALVLSTPYRPPLSMHPPTAPSIAIMLAFAKFAIKEKYWAKDIIFLITEHEQLGMQAWLEAYHGAECGDPGVLEHGDLGGRGGAIQAAINLELHDTNIGHVDIKIEGLNGQLPNLDLFNLACKMCAKEEIYYTFKGRPMKSFKHLPVKDWLYSFQTLMAMTATQATGIPNGNHGLYHRFGIQALTLEGFPSNINRRSRAGFLNIGRVIEGTFRSLNNLLERFHQSYFFYLLPSSERFISIGYYMPAIGVIVGALFIRACALWCLLNEVNTNNEDSTEKKGTESSGGPKRLSGTSSKTKEKQQKLDNLNKYKPTLTGYPDEYWKVARAKFEEEIQNASPPDKPSINVVAVLFTFVFMHAIGVLIMNSPQFVTQYASRYNYATDVSLFYSFLIISVVLLKIPYLISIRKCHDSMTLLNILALLELGIVLICISMNNISLAMFCALIIVPVALRIRVRSSLIASLKQSFFWLLVHPLSVLVITVLISTYLNFAGEKLKENFYRGIAATQQAIVFSIVDSMIYGNWLFSIVTSILIPNWLCFWIVSFGKAKVQSNDYNVNEEKKTN